MNHVRMGSKRGILRQPGRRYPTTSFAKRYYERNHPYVAQMILTASQKRVLMLLSVILLSVLVGNITLRAVVVDELFLALIVVVLLLINIPPLHRIYARLAKRSLDTSWFPATNIERDDGELPRYTILVPLYREGDVVRGTIQALSAIDYPSDKLEILLLIEEDDLDTRSALPALPATFSIVSVPSSTQRGKPRALNYGLERASGEFLTIYDAEDIPDPNQLRNAVAAFRQYGDDVWVLQARLRFNNPHENWLTLLFYAEYRFWYDVYLPFLKARRYPIPLGGTSNHVRTARIREIAGWDAFNVTEDADLTLKVYRRGGDVALLESITIEVAPTRIPNWIKQRSRWIKGLIQTFFVHTRGSQDANMGRYYLFCFSGIFMAVYTAILTVFLTFSGQNSYYDVCIRLSQVGLISSITINGVMYLHVLEERRLKHILQLVFPGILCYWLLYLTANFRAIYQLFTKPFHWDKTQHSSTS